MTQKILITSALPYANGPLHFGHIAGAYLPGDVYARYQRLKKNDVLYICGSDEYGVAITLSAEMAGRTPREHVDLYHQINKGFFDKLNFSFDHYSRTTCELHPAPSKQFFLKLLENGFIEEKQTQQLYSEDDDRFLADRYVIGICPECGYENARGDECPQCAASYEATDLKNPRSKVTGASLTLKTTNHWFLLLDQFKDKLNAWIDSKDWKPNVTNFVKGYIKNLRPRAITRDSDWGVSVPLKEAEGKVLYVWFEAPIGYISATKEWAIKIGQPEHWKDYWLDPKTKLVNFIGKDNIPFHAVIFPAMIMGQNENYILVDELPANEFYLLEGKQFSKSEGWYIDLDDFFQHYTTDQIRYMIAATAPETSDSEFTWKDFQKHCNSDLLGKYGNLVNRVLVFTVKHCNGVIPSIETEEMESIDQEFMSKVDLIVKQTADAYEHFKLRKATQLIMELAQEGNIYFDTKQPWKDAKQEETKKRMKITIQCCLYGLNALAHISSPIIPETANKVKKMLGFENRIEQWDPNLLEQEQKILKPEILFKKVEDEQINHEIEKLQSRTH